MGKSYFVFALCLVSAVFVSFTCNAKGHRKVNAKPVDIYQVKSIKSLLGGDYEGTVTVGTLRTYGNTGLGTFDRLNGEMIVLHDTVFQVRYNDKAKVAPDTEKIPFAAVAVIDNPKKLGTFSGGTEKELVSWLNAKIDTSKVYVAELTGTFSKLLVRSELLQKKPYKPFAEIIKTDERRYEYSDISGTIVAVYAPAGKKDIVGSGWHFHFICSNRKTGGHILDLTATSLQCEAQQISSIKIIEPTSSKK